MIDFNALERAFAPLHDVGRQEAQFEVGGQTVCLSPLLPSEETAAEEYARAWVEKYIDEEGNVPSHIQTAYYHTMRVEILSYAICQIGGLDLRGEDYIATGEVSPSGKALRVAKNVAIRELITKRQPWTQTMFTIAFNAYTELLARIERETGDLVKYDPSDLQTEIEQAKKRVEDLEQEMKRRAKGDPNLLADQVDSLRDHDLVNKAVQQAPEPVREPEPDPVPEPEPDPGPVPEPEWDPEPEWEVTNTFPTRPSLRTQAEPTGPVQPVRQGPRQPVLPPTIPPPTSGASMAPRPRTTPAAPPVHEEPDPTDFRDSFDDPDDPAVLQAEQERIMAARRRMLAEQQAARRSQSSVVRRPAPPHQRGVREEAVSLEATPIGNIGDAPAFRLPTQELSSRGRGHQAPRVEVSDEGSVGKGSQNPNFVPARKG